MPEVQTVLGPIDTSELGRVLMHEHLVVVDPEFHENFPGRWADGRWEEEAGRAAVVEKLRDLKAAGIDTLVDASIYPMGRNLERVRDLSRRSGVHVIVMTGLYVFDRLPLPLAVLPWTPGEGEDPLVELYVRDVTEGHVGTGIRSGFVKCSSDRPGITPGVERAMRAAARAHRLTGAPLTTHSKASVRGGLDQQRILAEEGVDLSRVIIGHCSETTDMDYLEELAAAGSYLGMDHFGFDVLTDWMADFGVMPEDIITFDDRVDVVVRLCAGGYANQLVLSHDYAGYLDWLPPGYEATMPRYNYLHVIQDVVPALRERGVTDEQIDAMLVDNPRRIFETQGAY